MIWKTIFMLTILLMFNYFRILTKYRKSLKTFNYSKNKQKCLCRLTVIYAK